MLVAVLYHLTSTSYFTMIILSIVDPHKVREGRLLSLLFPKFFFFPSHKVFILCRQFFEWSVMNQVTTNILVV